MMFWTVLQKGDDMLYSDKAPWIPGIVRGVLLAVIGAVVAFVAEAQTAQDLPAAVIAMVPIILLVLRSAEALVLDQFRSEDERYTPDM